MSQSSADTGIRHNRLSRALIYTALIFFGNISIPVSILAELGPFANS